MQPFNRYIMAFLECEKLFFYYLVFLEMKLVETH